MRKGCDSERRDAAVSGDQDGRVIRIRSATTDDTPFLGQMLAVAAYWRPGSSPAPIDEILVDPHLAHYVVGWGREGDLGVIAEEDRTPLGAAWCRRFDAAEPGYGFVAADVPELSIGVVEGARGRGIGRQLLEHLVAQARDRGTGRLSLSVELDNPARRLYERVGFVEVDRAGGAATMVIAVG